MCVQSLVGELRPYMQLSGVKKKKKKDDQRARKRMGIVRTILWWLQMEILLTSSWDEDSLISKFNWR